MHPEKLQAQLIMRLLDVDRPSHPFDKEVLAVGLENFADERMRLRKILADLPQCATDFRKFQIVNLAHSCKSMALEEVQEGKANGTTLNGLDNRRKFAKPGEPIAQGRVRNLEIDGDLGNAVGRVFVKSVVLCGHCD